MRLRGPRPLLVAALLLLLAPALLADVAEQRQRLPPPARCTDPVEGTWRAHKYFPNLGWSWAIFTLEVRRAGPEALAGRIHVRAWNGGPNDAAPGPCAPGAMHLTIVQPAQGALRNGQMTFAGTSWQIEQVLCGEAPASYYVDQFTGTIDPATEEMQSSNTDGGVLFADPIVFRRIACANPVPAPVVPPPPMQPSGNGGCSLRCR